MKIPPVVLQNGVHYPSRANVMLHEWDNGKLVAIPRCWIGSFGLYDTKTVTLKTQEFLRLKYMTIVYFYIFGAGTLPSSVNSDLSLYELSTSSLRMYDYLGNPSAIPVPCLVAEAMYLLDKYGGGLRLHEHCQLTKCLPIDTRNDAGTFNTGIRSKFYNFVTVKRKAYGFFDVVDTVLGLELMHVKSGILWPHWLSLSSHIRLAKPNFGAQETVFLPQSVRPLYGLQHRYYKNGPDAKGAYK